MDIQLKPCYSVTVALQIAKADSKSSILILLDLSAAFDTVNHQILLSTLSSLDITGHSQVESYLTGRSSGWPGEGRYSKHINWSLGFLRDRFLDPSSSPQYTASLGPIIQTHGISYHCYADDIQLYLSFRPDDATVAARILGCLADISAWMKEHHLQLNAPICSLLPCHYNTTTWFYLPDRFSNNYPIKLRQKSWGHFRWSAPFQRAHYKDCSILQVCIAQH